MIHALKIAVLSLAIGGLTAPADASTISLLKKIFRSPVHFQHAPAPSPSASPILSPVSNVASGKCFDISGGNTQPGAKLIEWPCTGSADEEFSIAPLPAPDYYALADQNSSLCLSNGGSIKQANLSNAVCDSGDSSQSVSIQADVKNGGFVLRFLNSGLCAEVATDGIQIQQSPCSGLTAQAFNLKPPESAH